ncbi:Golgi-associated plant pathogenesis-related protein 1 [Folsomia candida]|uniref:Golgi-associated plant pathogenesis-related protein 1 n=1 Tax=Folsomia candida TaxID=158441 RepID=A0A226DWS1_FOLCA|nr:Golgi-associated plant pathogenesis-related protein 1 [Folsomia candida]
MYLQSIPPVEIWLQKKTPIFVFHPAALARKRTVSPGPIASFPGKLPRLAQEYHDLVVTLNCVPGHELSQGCQEYAESLRASVKPGEWFSHSAGAGADYGETMTGPNNWAWIRSVNFGQWLVDEMYGEIKNYDWAKPDFQVGPNGQVVGHFATLVWKSSTNLGVGVADPTGHETNGAVHWKKLEKFKLKCSGIPAEDTSLPVFVEGKKPKNIQKRLMPTFCTEGETEVVYINYCDPISKDPKGIHWKFICP